MSVELITYGSDRRLELGGAEAIRAPSYLDDWTKIRVGLQFSFNAVASNITTSPDLSIGVCHGSDNVLVASTADHVVGCRLIGVTYTHTTGPPAYFDAGSNKQGRFKKVVSTVTSATVGGTFGTPQYFPNATAVRNILLVEITKGSPNFTLAMAVACTAGAAQSDVTDAMLQTMMEMATITNATVSAAAGLADNSYNVETYSTLAVSEGTNGVLDHLFVYWDRATHKFSFNIRHRKIA